MATDWWDKVEYGRFRLSDFRWHAASLIKYLIRAREKDEPGFLGNHEAYERWGLANIAKDNASQVDLLKMARAASRLVDADMVAMGGSGGVSEDDPLGDFKSLVAGFSLESSIDGAICALDRKKPIKWSAVAEWKDLETIRDGLDRLPTKGNDPTGPPPDWICAPLATSNRVTLFPHGHVPAAYIDNQPIPRLTEKQHNVIEALLGAGPDGLSLRELKKRSGEPGARGMLHTLAKSEMWRCVIGFAGVRGNTYRIY